MTDVLPHSGPSPAAPETPQGGWLQRLVSSRNFQKWAAGFPLIRRHVRREGEALFNLMAGFCHSQALMAFVKLGLPEMLMKAPSRAVTLSHRTNVPLDRMEILLRATAALGLVKNKNGIFHLTTRGLALQTVPGLSAMIQHHDVLYRDLDDPVAFFRGETKPELAHFWPYVFGGQMSAASAETYSRLMSDSQELVAEDTLRAVSLNGVTRLMDVGGGTGAFARAVAQSYPDLNLVLYDLPEVISAAQKAGLPSSVSLASGSFKLDPLPRGADAISLIRILFDHNDQTVLQLLEKCFDALPSGGQLIISEPMLGGDTPCSAGDSYYALYTLAMETGKTRSSNEIRDLCERVGFKNIRAPRSNRPFITSTITMCK